MEDNLKFLKEAGLYGRGLLAINDPSLVSKYNKCLEGIGVEKTSLKKFSIDGMGWSPEIALEKQNRDYLSHEGISSPYAVLLSSEQEGLPLYNPFYSFYREMMDEIFAKFRLQIKDLTLRTSIYVDLDEGITRIATPADLLLVEWLSLKFNIVGPIAQVAKRQREIVSDIVRGENWADENVTQELIDNVKQYGDLRFEKTQLTDLPFTDIRSFYTSAFGGVYVFRDIDSVNPMLIHADQDGMRRIGRMHTEYCLYDPDLYEQLIGHKFIELHANKYGDSEKLERLAECLFVHALTDADEEIDVQSISPGQRKKIALELINQNKLSKVYEELIRIAHLSKRERSAELKNPSDELQKILAHPHRSIDGSARIVMHRLLAHMFPLDVVELYAYARETFFELYQKWPKNRQAWAAQYLKEHYVSRTSADVLSQTKTKKRRK
jgi:hypothetical protein